jgi:hypothetical protein
LAIRRSTCCPVVGADCGCGVYARSLFIATTGANQLLMASPSGALANRDDWSTILGTGEAGGRDGDSQTQAQFNKPAGIALALNGDKPTSIPQNRKVYVADSGNHTIRRINWTLSHLNTPSGIDVNDKGEIFIVDTFSHTIRMLKDGMLTTIAGQPGVSGFADGDGATAKFNAPEGLKIAPDGSIVVADTGNNVIRRLTLR